MTQLEILFAFLTIILIITIIILGVINYTLEQWVNDLYTKLYKKNEEFMNFTKKVERQQNYSLELSVELNNKIDEHAKVCPLSIKS